MPADIVGSVSAVLESERVPIRFRIFLRVAIGLSSAALLCPITAQTKTPDQVYEKVAKSVVIVGGLDSSVGLISQGSGVVVGKNYVITNCHVVSNVRDIRIVQNELSFRARLLRKHAFADLCLLNVPNLPLSPISSLVSI